MRFRRSPLVPRLFASFAALLLAASPAFAQHPVQIKHVPSLVSDGRSQLLGDYGKSEKLHLTLNLALRNEEELDDLIPRLYDPASPLFRKYLTPGEFDARFGPTQRSYNSVLQWAESQGFKVGFKASNLRLVEVDASVEDVNRAFNVTIKSYHDAGLNRDFHAPDREPTVDLDVPLASVSGLDDAEPIHNYLKAGPNATATRAGESAHPVAPITAPTSLNGTGATSTAILGGIDGNSSLPTSISAPSVAVPESVSTPRIVGSGPANTYLPSDMRAAYYGTGSLDGTGQTVDIFSFDGYNTSDVTGYYTNTGTTQTVPVQNVLVGTYAGTCFASNTGTSGTCDDGEQVLDIVNVIGMAPKLTKIYFYEYTSASTELNQMVLDNYAKVISSSWGGGGFGTASDTYFKQMITQGITYLNATGDSGGFNSSTYSAPSLDPYIIQVGGTSLVTASAGGPWASETAWANSGGGFWVSGISSSGKYAIPTFQSQTGVVTATNKASATYRNVPDMAAEGDFDNTTYDNGAFLSGYGGTSYATPRMAGYIALANQKSIANGGATVGFFDTTLYNGGVSTSAGHYLHDITSGSNPSTAGTTVYTYNSVAGYDLVTGWGSPNYDGLLNYLAAIPDFSMSVSSAAMTLARDTTNTGTETVTITAYSGFAGTVGLSASGLPTGLSYTTTSGTTTSAPTISFAANPATSQQGTYTITLTGTSGSTSHTTTFILNVLKRVNGDFTISASSPSIIQTTSGISTVTVNTGAIPSPILLSVSGLPTGVTAAFTNGYVFSPGTTTSTSTGTDTLTLAVPDSVVAGTYTVTVTGTSSGNIVHTTTLTLTVTAPTSYVLNGGFETLTNSTTAANWTLTSGVLTSGSGAHSGTEYAYLDGYGAVHTDTATQTGIAIPAGKTTATLTFFLYIATAETTTTAKNDTLTVSLTPTTPAGTATTIATFSNLDAGTGYVFHQIDVSAYIGQTVTLTFTGVENASLTTFFKLDDVALFTNQ